MMMQMDGIEMIIELLVEELPMYIAVSIVIMNPMVQMALLKRSVVAEKDIGGQFVLVVRVVTLVYPMRSTPVSTDLPGRHARTVVHAVYPHRAWNRKQVCDERRFRSEITRGKGASRSQTQAG
eukprot:IDg8914t1